MKTRHTPRCLSHCFGEKRARRRPKRALFPRKRPAWPPRSPLFPEKTPFFAPGTHFLPPKPGVFAGSAPDPPELQRVLAAYFAYDPPNIPPIASDPPKYTRIMAGNKPGSCQVAPQYTVFCATRFGSFPAYFRVISRSTPVWPNTLGQLATVGGMFAPKAVIQTRFY